MVTLRTRIVVWINDVSRLTPSLTLRARNTNIPANGNQGPVPPLKVKVFSYSSGGLTAQGGKVPGASGAEVALNWNAAEKYG